MDNDVSVPLVIWNCWLERSHTPDFPYLALVTQCCFLISLFFGAAPSLWWPWVSLLPSLGSLSPLPHCAGERYDFIITESQNHGIFYVGKVLKAHWVWPFPQHSQAHHYVSSVASSTQLLNFDEFVFTGAIWFCLWVKSTGQAPGAETLRVLWSKKLFFSSIVFHPRHERISGRAAPFICKQEWK